jgi:ketosteroid isomerase-like protein
MSRENVEVVWRWAPVIGRADPAGYATMIDAIFAPDAEWIEDPRWPSSATVRGRETIKARTHEYVEGFDWRLTIEDVLDAGTHVLVVLNAFGRGEASGIETHMEWACLLGFERGEVVSWRWFLDRSEALEAAALRD